MASDSAPQTFGRLPLSNRVMTFLLSLFKQTERKYVIPVFVVSNKTQRMDSNQL